MKRFHFTMNLAQDEDRSALLIKAKAEDPEHARFEDWSWPTSVHTLKQALADAESVRDVATQIQRHSPKSRLAFVLHALADCVEDAAGPGRQDSDADGRAEAFTKAS